MPPTRAADVVVIFFTIITLISGCASVPAEKPPEPRAQQAPGQPTTGEKGWWYARFQFAWPQETPPVWPRDLLIAHRVVAPVLRRHRINIDLWRFHRRAVRDQAGHQISFVFYAPAQTAARIYQAFNNDALLARLGEADLVSKTVFDDPRTVARPDIAATSDPRWSQPIARAWPYFIMGVSEMWLDLIEQLAAAAPAAEQDSPPELEAFYQQISEQVDILWQQEGQHALLHHLNALFAYTPLPMRF